MLASPLLLTSFTLHLYIFLVFSSFDELKYSLKKSEEVVYNLTLRDLKPKDSVDTSG